jgi:hypothetical protein
MGRARALSGPWLDIDGVFPRSPKTYQPRLAPNAMHCVGHRPARRAPSGLHCNRLLQHRSGTGPLAICFGLENTPEPVPISVGYAAGRDP